MIQLQEQLVLYDEVVSPELAELTTQIQNIGDGARTHKLGDMSFGVVPLAIEAWGPDEMGLVGIPAEDKPIQPSRIHTTHIVSHWLDVNGPKIDIVSLTDTEEPKKLLEEVRDMRGLLLSSHIGQASLSDIRNYWAVPRKLHTPTHANLAQSPVVTTCKINRAPFAAYQVGNFVNGVLSEDMKVIREMHPNLLDPDFVLDATLKALRSSDVPKRIFAFNPYRPSDSRRVY